MSEVQVIMEISHKVDDLFLDIRNGFKLDLMDEVKNFDLRIHATKYEK